MWKGYSTYRHTWDITPSSSRNQRNAFFQIHIYYLNICRLENIYIKSTAVKNYWEIERITLYSFLLFILKGRDFWERDIGWEGEHSVVEVNNKTKYIIIWLLGLDSVWKWNIILQYFVIKINDFFFLSVFFFVITFSIFCFWLILEIFDTE